MTHAHEDHIGAIAHLWPKLKCKIFATPFTAVLIKEKFKEKQIDITKHDGFPIVWDQIIVR